MLVVFFDVCKVVVGLLEIGGLCDDVGVVDGG